MLEVHPSTRSCEWPSLPLMLPTPRPSMAKHAIHQQSHGRISKTPTPLAAVTKNERAAWMPSQRACSITLLGRSISFWSRHSAMYCPTFLLAWSSLQLDDVKSFERCSQHSFAVLIRFESVRIASLFSSPCS